MIMLKTIDIRLLGIHIMRDGSVVKEISDKAEINDENILQYTIGLK